MYLRFGGSICRCLGRWMEAPILEDPSDNSYWEAPVPLSGEETPPSEGPETLCSGCLDDIETKYYKERFMGKANGPTLLEFWTLGDPRFNDENNPLYAPNISPDIDWREKLDEDSYRQFYRYARDKYSNPENKCKECQNLKQKRDKCIHVCSVTKIKKKKHTKEQKALFKDLVEVKECIDHLQQFGNHADYEATVQDLLQKKPRVRKALEEVNMSV